MKSQKPESGQSTLLFAILLPIMSLFLLGILDAMITNARTMETVVGEYHHPPHRRCQPHRQPFVSPFIRPSNWGGAIYWAVDMCEKLGYY